MFRALIAICVGFFVLPFAAAGQEKPNSATPGDAAGAPKGNAPILSVREQDILRGEINAQLRKCWKLPGSGGGIENRVVTVRWKLLPDGTLDGEPEVVDADKFTGLEKVVFDIAAEAAVRAVKTCAPFKLPQDKHYAWKSIIWDFDPRESLEPKQPVDKEAAAAAQKLYLEKVHAKIAACTPAKPEWKGVATVLFLLMPDGTLISRKIIESSGVPEIDAAALRTLDACRPFDRFDRAMGDVALYSKVRIDFSSRSAGGTGDDLRVAMKEYNAAVFEHLLKHKVNPRTQKAGTVKVAFSVGSNGELLSAEIEESSGHDELDAAALLTLDRAAPYPLPPREYGGQPARLHAPFSYTVQQR